MLLRVRILLRRARATALKLRGLKEAKDVGPIGRLSGRLVDLGDGGGLLPTPYFLRATASAPVISTVVLADLTAPPAAMASAMAAMLSLFGTSAMMVRS